ncbi:MAG: APC family permease [bacterium]
MGSSNSGAVSPTDKLSRVLGFWQVTASGVGIIVGAGIYVLVGAATREAGAAVWLGFVLAAILSALTALSYCELAAMYPRAGAEYEYARNAFPETVAFLVGWVMVAGLVVASGAVALGFARYLREFVTIDERVGAVMLLVVVGLIALSGIKNSARLTLVLCAIQVTGLLLVVGVGIGHVGDVNLTAGASSSGVLGAAALVFFAFIGFDEVITLAEETRNPSRTIPMALLTSLAISAVLYVAVAVVAVSVLGPEALGGSERPLADVVAHALGGASVRVVAVIALLTTLNTTLLALTAGSRLAYGMAVGGALPRAISRLNQRQAPSLSIGLCLLGAAGFALSGSLEVVAGVTDTAVYLVFLAVNGAVLVLRFRSPSSLRPFKVPLAIRGIAVVPVLGLLATILMLTQLDGRSLALGGALVGLGLLVSIWRGLQADSRSPAEI